MDNPTFSDNETELQPLFDQLDHLTYGLMVGLTWKELKKIPKLKQLAFNQEAKSGIWL